MTKVLSIQRILLALGILVFLGAAIVGATGAFFSDTETSTGNTFSAGSLDLKVDSEAHYNGALCVKNGEENTNVPGDEYIWDDGSEVGWPVEGTPCVGTFEETDLGPLFKFFNLTDVKPGDVGENTISLHVYDNDAWGRFVINGVTDLDNTCTEPESDPLVPDPECNAVPGTPGAGELAESISFSAWIDDGQTPGFQGLTDPGEGDNVQQQNEQTIITPGPVDAEGETHNIWPALAAYRDYLDLSQACVVTDPDGNGQTDNDGTPSEDDYLACQGIAEDGRLVGSTTYYFGLDWNIPTSVGNEAQTDSLVADLTFEVEQYRNNPTPFNDN
ncbi:MAG: SipW-dependent-type signal peptide-containing protein [Minisyncoccia bacterium]